MESFFSLIFVTSSLRWIIYPTHFHPEILAVITEMEAGQWL